MNGMDVCISAVGMVSSLGHRAVTSCAAARAGVTRASELKVVSQPFGKLTMDGPPEVHGHAVPGIGTGFSGAGKVLTLGAAALRDLLAQRPIDADEEAHTGFCLCLSDLAVLDAYTARHAETQGASGPPPSAAWSARAPALALALAGQAKLAIPAQHVTALTAGSPGFARALQTAAQQVAKGVFARCIVGAVDSRIEPKFLTAAADLGALRTNVRPAGLIGGEAAAFVLLERRVDLDAAGRSPVALLSSFGFACESTGHFGETPATGRALMTALEGALHGSPSLAGTLGLWIGDLNGTERRSYEWGTALMRLRAAGLAADLPAWYPATSFGDTGAAAGAVYLCMAAEAFQRDYSPGRGVVIWLQSESGASAAIGVEAPR